MSDTVHTSSLKLIQMYPMNQIIYLKTFCLLTFLAFVFSQIYACDSSRVSLISYGFDGTNHNYQIELCVGAGILGPTTGADDETRNFAIALYKVGSTINVPSFTNSITPVLGAASSPSAFTGNVIGAQPNPPFEAQNIIFYAGSGAFACISSTAGCGQPRSECYTIDISTDVYLDSLKMYGIEGVGNPIAGCTGNASMKLDLLALLPVTYARFEADQLEEGVNLRWTTSSEVNNDYFSIEHSIDAQHFAEIGREIGRASQGKGATYSFVHRNPQKGWNYYRIRQTDIDGQFSYSSTLQIQVSQARNIRWETGADGRKYTLTGLSEDQVYRVLVFDAQGKLIREMQMETGVISLDTSSWPSGIYTLSISGNALQYQRKILVQE